MQNVTLTQMTSPKSVHLHVVVFEILFIYLLILPYVKLFLH